MRKDRTHIKWWLEILLAVAVGSAVVAVLVAVATWLGVL